ncbi:MAG: hypothetical protein FJ102_17770 [Deltaproteobacteria bacterium]|nr:hypothetical protein [Deltaproteobacteria bacterium]
MADTYVQGPDNVVVWINDSTGADASKVFQVKHLTGSNPPVLLEVREVGDVIVYGGIRRQGDIFLHNTSMGDGTVTTWKRGSTTVATAEYESATGMVFQTPSGSGLDQRFAAAGGVTIQIGPAAGVQARNPSGGNYWQVTDDGMVFKDALGHMLIEWYPAIGWMYGGTVARVEVGSAYDGFRGVLRVRADTAAGKPGVLELRAKDGTPYFLWVRASTGFLHIHDADPGSNDALGTEVRNQS